MAKKSSKHRPAKKTHQKAVRQKSVQKAAAVQPERAAAAPARTKTTSSQPKDTPVSQSMAPDSRTTRMVAIGTVLALCVVAIVFTVVNAGSHDNTVPAASGQGSSLIQVVNEDDILGSGAGKASTGAANALQTQNTNQSPQAPAPTNPLHAGSVTLQAGSTPNTNAMDVNR